MVVAEQGMVVADQAGMKKQYIYICICRDVYTACTCSNIQGWLGEEYKGFDWVWVYIGRNIKWNTNGYVRDEYKSTGGQPECRGNAVGNWICLHDLETYTNKLNAFGAPQGHNTKKKWTIAAVNVVWHELWKISKPSVCGAMRMEDIWHLTLTSLTPPHQIQMRFKSKLSTRNIFHPQDWSK